MVKDKNWHIIINVLVLFLVVISSLGCKSEPHSTQNEQLVFRYNEHKNISSLDPAYAKDIADIWAINQLFNGLVQMDENMQVKPSIAKSWSVSDDGLIYKFKLREDVYFHSHELFGPNKTRLVKAEDFVHSFNRLKDPEIASPGMWTMNKIDHYKAVNDSIFQIKLKSAFAAFLGQMTMKYCSVVPKEITEFYGSEFRKHPIGTGAFKFKRWEENIKLVFRKNENYFEKNIKGQKLPFLEAVAITFLPDKQSEFLQFLQGNLDFISGIDSSYKDELLLSDGLLNPKYTEKIDLLRSPYLNTEYLGFFLNSKNNLLQNKKIRKAINYGFDRKKMITYLRNGVGIPANGGFIPKGLQGHSADIGYTYNPQKAKILISEYKQENKVDKLEVTLNTTASYLSFCEFIQKEMKDLGLEIKIDVMPAAALKSAKANGKSNFFRASWVADYPDAQNYLSLFYSKNKAPLGPNYTHFENAEFDKLYLKSLSENNTTKRNKLYRKMDSLITAEAAVVCLFYDEVLRFKHKTVQNLGTNPINLLELKQVRK